MKLRLLDYLRCLECGARLTLREAAVETVARTDVMGTTRCSGLCGIRRMDPQAGDCRACAQLEVMTGVLGCERCAAKYEVVDGVPRLRAVRSRDETRPRTAASFGYLWAKSTPGNEAYDATSYHFAKMEASLSLDPPSGLVLDAGCGDGIDLAAQAQREGVEAIGVELSDGGCRTSYVRTRPLSRAHVVQADLCQLPFAGSTFDFGYSYGVLHHIGVPARGLREVVRVAKPGARIVAYLYEDFSERNSALRWSLAAANRARALTTRLPHRVLYKLCLFGSPLVFTLFTFPARLSRRFQRTAWLAANLPFRHGTGPFSLVGDLFDRFSAPVEWRYSRAGSIELFADAGLERVTTVAERGWMVAGVKPGG